MDYIDLAHTFESMLNPLNGDEKEPFDYFKDLSYAICPTLDKRSRVKETWKSYYYRNRNFKRAAVFMKNNLDIESYKSYLKKHSQDQLKALNKKLNLLLGQKILKKDLLAKFIELTELSLDETIINGSLKNNTGCKNLNLQVQLIKSIKDFDTAHVIAPGKTSNSAFNIYVYAPGIEKDILAILKDSIAHSSGNKGVNIILASTQLNAQVFESTGHRLIDYCDYFIGIIDVNRIQPQEATKVLFMVNNWARKMKPVSFYINERKDDQKPAQKWINAFELRYKDNRRRSEFEDFQYFYGNNIKDRFEQSFGIVFEKGKFRSSWDSDIIARNTSVKGLIKDINEHTPEVAMNLLFHIFQEKLPDSVWEAIAAKLIQGTSYLKESLLFLVDYKQFNHSIYLKLVRNLAATNQTEYARFLNHLYDSDPVEFELVDTLGLGDDSNINIHNLHQKINDYIVR